MSKQKNTEVRYPININILKQLRFSASSAGKTVNWILTFGKTAVFITFGIVILTFFYRYTLDNKVQSLKEKIKTNLESIQSYSDIEFKIRKTQDKIYTVKKLAEFNKDSISIFQKIENNIPKEILLETLNINNLGKNIQLRGKATNEVVFSQMLDALKKQDQFTELSIDELSSGGVINPEIDFTINIIMK